MAFLRVNSTYNGTITEVSDSPISNLQPDETQETTSYIFPPLQPVYYYRWNGSDVEENTQENIDNYLNASLPPPTADEPVDISAAEYTGITAETASKLESTIFDSYTAATKVEMTAVQARQSSAVDNIPEAWTDFDFDITDIENDDSIIEHDDTNRDDFLIKADGLYYISYIFIINDEAQGRLRINDTTVIDGSESEFDMPGNTGPVITSVLVNLNDGDKVTLQTFGLTGGQDIIAGATIKIFRLETTIGPQGIAGPVGSGSNINILYEDSFITGTPFSEINFSGGVTVVSGSTADRVTITVPSNVATNDKLQLVDSAGGQNLNAASPVTLNWGQQDFIDTSTFTHTVGQSTITVLKAGLYELSFNVNGASSNGRSIPGIQFRRNSNAIAPTLTADYGRNTSNNDTNNSLPPYLITLAVNDTIDVIAFRLGDATSNTSKAGASFVRINYLG